MTGDSSDTGGPEDRPPSFTLPSISTQAAALVVLAVVLIVGYQWLHERTKSEGAKLGAALGQSCDRVGIMAAFGGRSNLYRCTSFDRYGYELHRCDIWVDGAAYDVTKQARAVFRLQREAAPC